MFCFGYNVIENRGRMIRSVLMEKKERFQRSWVLREVAVMLINAIVVMSFVGVFVGKCYYFSKYSHKR